MATTEIYTLSLHDALPICRRSSRFSTARSRSRSKPEATVMTIRIVITVASGLLLDLDLAVENRELRRQIGRASCRERVYISVVAISLKKRKLLWHSFSTRYYSSLAIT